uniref:Uncharacterized protein n=1 Tax=Cynoglossus semilaevis TaxID=244447 RepID=A0A3P8UL72_CYNSE
NHPDRNSEVKVRVITAICLHPSSDSTTSLTVSRTESSALRAEEIREPLSQRRCALLPLKERHRRSPALRNDAPQRTRCTFNCGHCPTGAILCGDCCYSF